MSWQLGFAGYLEIRLSGSNPERVINMAMSRGIHVWDIYQDPGGEMVCKVRLGGYKALRYIVRKSGCRVRIRKKKGLPFLVMRAKRRKILVLGLLFFCLSLYFLSSFIWFVEVAGNVKVPREVILERVAANGLEVGMAKGALQREYITEKLLLDIPELSWATVHVQGSRVIIEVAEKTLIPHNDEAQPGDLLARVAGKVEEMLILKGTALIKEGDYVQQGQPIISGLYYPQIQVNPDGSITPAGAPERVRARGLVRARVLHRVETQCPLLEELIQDTGREEIVTLLKWYDKEVYLAGKPTEPFERYRQIRQTKTLLAGRNPWGPVELINIVYREQVHHVQEWGLEGAYQEAVRRARIEAEKELPADCRIINERAEPLPSQEPSLIRVLYIMETIEDIGSYADSLRP